MSYSYWLLLVKSKQCSISEFALGAGHYNETNEFVFLCLQPSSMNSNLRSLLAIMRDEYDWRFSLELDFTFQGGLSAKIAKMHSERAIEWPDVYGTASTKKMPDIDHVNQINLTVFDENDLRQHQQKLLLTNGLYPHQSIQA